MSIQQHVSESAPGVVGTTAAGGFTAYGFLDHAMPVLQAVSLLAGILVAAVTFVYYWRKIKAENVIKEAELTASALKAQAVVTAAALVKEPAVLGTAAIRELLDPNNDANATRQ